MRTDKQKVVTMRQDGWSYSDISHQLGVSKGTLSAWLRDISYSPNATVRDRIKTGQGIYGVRRHEERITEAQDLKIQGQLEVGDVSQRDLWMLGIGLWLGEGSKTLEQIRLVNSDPTIIRLFVRWLKEICELEDNNITLAMHLYPDSVETDCKSYWSNVTGLPLTQFRKTQIDRRLDKKLVKFGKSPFGTLHVTVVSNKNLDRGVRLHRRMMGWVAAATK